MAFIPEWLANLTKDSEHVELKKQSIYKKQTLNIIDPTIAGTDLRKKISPITLVVQATKAKSNNSGTENAVVLAYWEKSLNKVAETAISSPSDAVMTYDNYVNRVQDINNMIQDSKFDEAEVKSKELLDEMQKGNKEETLEEEIVSVEGLPKTEPKLDDEEYLTTIDIGQLTKVESSLKFQFKDDYLDTIYFRVTEDNFKRKLASRKPDLSYNTFNKPHVNLHNYIVSFYKNATLDSMIPVGDVVLIERDGTNQNWVILGEGNDILNAFNKVCRRLTVYPEDIGLASNSKGELVKSSSVSMVFFDTPEEAAKWQTLNAKTEDKKEPAPAASTEKLEKAMDELEVEPSGKKEEKPFKSFKDYQEEKKEEAAKEEPKTEEKTYSAEKTICADCGKENEKTGHQDCMYPGRSGVQETYSSLRLSKLDKVADKAAETSAREMVGDGKEPNKYWVTAGDSYLVYDKNGNYKEHGTDDVETFGPFNTFKEAKDKYDDIVSSLISPEEGKGNHSVMIEDRLSGTIYEGMYEGREAVNFEFDERDDTKYTREKLSDKFASNYKFTEKINKDATYVTYYNDVKEVKMVHYDENTARFCLEWTNGDWRADLDEPAVIEYLANDHLSKETIAEVLEKSKKMEQVELKKKQNKDGEVETQVSKIKELEKVKKALLEKGFDKEAQIVDELIKESFHLNPCQTHKDNDSYLCQVCAKEKCSGCSMPEYKDGTGNICSECKSK